MTMSKPLISIGIPVYNGEKTIGAALRALCAQTYSQIEIIISDNASLDKTVEVIESFNDQRIKLFRQSHNIGATKNFEFVKEHATGEFFMWHSHDDWLDVDYIEKCLQLLLADKNVSLVSGGANYFEGETLVSVGERTQFLEERPFDRMKAYYRRVTDNGVFYGISRKSVLDQMVMKNCLGADWMIIAALAWSGKIIHTDQTSINRRLGGTSRSFNNIVRSLRLSKINYFIPYVMIAFSCAVDILTSKAYSNTSLLQRFLMAMNIFLLINYRIAKRRVFKVIAIDPLREKQR